MRKAAKQIILGAAALAVLCVVIRFAFFSKFYLYFPAGGEAGEDVSQWNARVSVSDPEVLRAGEAAVFNGFVRIPFYAQGPGEADVTVATKDDTISYFHVLKADRFRMIYDASSGNFTGDTAVLVGVTLFWLLVFAIMLWRFFQAKGAAFYDYGTIYYAGFSLFSLSSGLVMLSVTVSHLAHPESYSMYSAYSAISGASVRYMILSTPAMLFFAAALAVSNIALLRHESPRPQNMLGLLLSLLLIAGEAAGWYLFSRDMMVSEWQGRLDNALQNTYATLFIYGQCMLTGAAVCGITAARRVPDADKDFIIILGCWFRKDGSLPPLLKGRVDKALSFWHSQKEATGREACFVPSGGQGPDESMPEAEAMRRYLLAEGVPPERVSVEPKAANTYENMAFSRAMIEEIQPGGSAVFATTNYHVFRSGVWAAQAGLRADGIGSRTKWWFWPNAFMRECAGLLRKRWWQELLMLIALIAFFALLTMTLA